MSSVSTPTPVDGTKPQNWYFTFGCGQANAGCYTVIFGTCDNSRDEAFRRYGRNWCLQYPESRWKLADGRTIAEKWGWRLIDAPAVEVVQ